MTCSHCRIQHYKNAMLFFDNSANQEWLVEQNVPSFHKQYLRNMQATIQEEITFLTSLLQSNELFESVPSEMEDVSTYQIRDMFTGRCL